MFVTGKAQRRLLLIGAAAGLMLAFGAASCARIGLLDPLNSTQIPSPPPPTLAQITSDPEPAGTPSLEPALEPQFTIFQDGRVRLVDMEANVLASWDAPGLDPDEDGWYQVVGDALYYLDRDDGRIYLNRQGSEVSLEFTGEAPVNGFAVSGDGERIAWSTREQGIPGLWIASTNGLGRTQIMDEPPEGASTGELSLEPVMWTGNGDLVFAWNYLGMGEDPWSDGYASLYLYQPDNDEVRALAALPDTPATSCWRAFTMDTAYLAGTCGSPPGNQQLRIVEVSSDLEERVLSMDGQSQVGPAAFSYNRKVAYTVLDRSGMTGTVKVALRSFPGDEPSVLLVLEEQIVSHLEWLGEDSLLLQIGGQDPSVLLLSLNGQQRQLASGWLLGWVNAAADPD